MKVGTTRPHVTERWALRSRSMSRGIRRRWVVSLNQQPERLHTSLAMRWELSFRESGTHTMRSLARLFGLSTKAFPWRSRTNGAESKAWMSACSTSISMVMFVVRTKTSSTGRHLHERAAYSCGLCSSRYVRDVVRAARLARLHLAIRRVCRTTENSDGSLLHIQLSDGSCRSDHRALSRHGSLLRPRR